MREEFLKKLADEIALEQGTDAGNELKKLIHIEQQRNQAESTRRILKPNHIGGLTSILIPSATEYKNRESDNFNVYDINQMWEKIQKNYGHDIKNWDRITERQQMEQLILQWQRKHFEQANKTPLAQKSWNDIFDDDTIQQAIQDGTFDIPKTLPIECQQLIKQMRRPSCIKTDIPSVTSLQDFRQFIKKTKETTPSPPSGRHYGHYATLLKADPIFLRIIHGILEIALSNNIILNRWKVTHTTLLEKIPGNPWIHSLRAIHIVEGDLQFIAKYFYSVKMMKTAETKKLITDEQYGGRAQRMAQSAVIHKLLYYNISHQTHTSAAFMGDDTRACYDRIVTRHSSIESRKWELSAQITNFTTKFINSQNFHIRTSHGISEGEYHYYDEQTPIQGSGQGLSWAGPRWTATGDSITNVMAMDCAGMYFVDPANRYSVHKNGDHFVDDRASGATANCTHNNNTPLEQIRHDEQKHAFLLYSTGHQLALDKCSYYYYKYKRHGTKHVYTMIRECPGESKLQEKYGGDFVTIKRLEPSEPHKNLGCHISVTMNQSKQFEKLREKIIE